MTPRPDEFDGATTVNAAGQILASLKRWMSGTLTSEST